MVALQIALTDVCECEHWHCLEKKVYKTIYFTLLWASTVQCVILDSFIALFDILQINCTTRV